MRHGITDWNMQHRLQGNVDIPLNEKGRQMARDAREKYKNLHFDICYCSPLKRAHETAEIFLEGSGTPIVVDERLHEMGFGIYEGKKNMAETPSSPIYTMFQNPANYVAVNGAESFEELYERSGSFIHDVLRPDYVEEKNILIVAHGALNCSIINRYKNIPLADFWDKLQGNCELIRIV